MFRMRSLIDKSLLKQEFDSENTAMTAAFVLLDERRDEEIAIHNSHRKKYDERHLY